MILFLHIISALTGIIVSTLTLYRPAAKLFRLSYASLFATLATGSLLVVVDSSRLLHTCIMGTVYSVISLLVLSYARRRNYTS